MFLCCNTGRYKMLGFESPYHYDMCKWIDGCAVAKFMEQEKVERKGKGLEGEFKMRQERRPVLSVTFCGVSNITYELY